MKLVVTPGPHLTAKDTTRRIMLDVAIALLPASISAVYFFGLQGLVVMLVSAIVAMITESLVLNGLKNFWQPQRLLGDGSAFITGLILAHIITPLLPIWMVVVGSALSILIAKQVFGGIGSNIFNPALVGRAILLASWPIAMATWKFPLTGGISGATPLVASRVNYTFLFMGRVPGSLGETSVLAILLGGAYLLWRGHIDWRVPATYLGSTALLSFLLGVNPLFSVMAGGVAYGAFFMATDMVTTPVTKKGRIIFGLGCGIITVAIREFGGLPEGVTYAILIMNAATPLLDRLTRPRGFGGEANA